MRFNWPRVYPHPFAQLPCAPAPNAGKPFKMKNVEATSCFPAKKYLWIWYVETSQTMMFELVDDRWFTNDQWVLIAVSTADHHDCHSNGFCCCFCFICIISFWEVSVSWNLRRPSMIDQICEPRSSVRRRFWWPAGATEFEEDYCIHVS